MHTTPRRWLLAMTVIGSLAVTLAIPQPRAFAAIVWPTPTVAQTIGGLTEVTNIVSPRDGTGRMFVTEKSGLIKVVKGGSVLATPALDIRSFVTTGGERGLLGLAFPPGFAAKQYAYIYFTDVAGNSRIARVRVSATDPDVFDRTTWQLILKVVQPYTNHNGGQLAFGPDGYLYIGLGDGGSGGDPGNRAQSKAVLLGKILRINVESTPGSPGYRVPRTNPFYGQRGRRGEIWAYGLRNPWRFSFDGRGYLWIGDVGQSKWEEIDRLAPGAKGRNLGWARYEGHHLYKARSFARGYTWPVTEMRHPYAESVIGGYVYYGSASPSMRGTYYFGDFVTGRIWGLKRSGTGWARKLLLDTTSMISTFGTDEAGEIWFADLANGTINRLAAP